MKTENKNKPQTEEESVRMSDSDESIEDQLLPMYCKFTYVPLGLDL